MALCIRESRIDLADGNDFRRGVVSTISDDRPHELYASTREGARECVEYLLYEARLPICNLLLWIGERTPIVDGGRIIFKSPDIRTQADITIPVSALTGTPPTVDALMETHKPLPSIVDALLVELLSSLDTLQLVQHDYVGATFCLNRISHLGSTGNVWKRVWNRVYKSHHVVHAWLFDLYSTGDHRVGLLVTSTHHRLAERLGYDVLSRRLLDWQQHIHVLYTDEQIRTFASLVHPASRPGEFVPYPVEPGAPIKWVRSRTSGADEYTTGLIPGDVLEVSRFLECNPTVVCLVMGDVCLAFHRRDMLVLACALDEASVDLGPAYTILRPFEPQYVDASQK